MNLSDPTRAVTSSRMEHEALIGTVRNVGYRFVPPGRERTTADETVNACRPASGPPDLWYPKHLIRRV